jgi:hypothetical protein
LEKANEILDFGKFWKELGDLLSGEGLPTDLVNVLALRQEFFRHYVSAIRDTPVEYSEGQPARPEVAPVKRHLKRLTMKTVDTDLTSTPVSVGVQFDIETHDPEKHYRWKAVFTLASKIEVFQSGKRFT